MAPSIPRVGQPDEQPPGGDQRRHDGSPSPVPASRRPIHPWIVLGAGAAAALGSFLPWATVSAPLFGSISTSGVDGGDGWITAALGMALVGFGTLVLRGQDLHRALGIVTMVAALALLALGAWKVADLSSAEETLRQDLANASGDDVFDIRASLSESVQVRIGIGLWLITLAGLAGSVATTLALFAGRSRGGNR
ncbi:hypothetical protein AB0J82_05810 [Asanoa sp. NPDC049518]|uniref:hypothetical protein n=1 Tax=unclassified Asanoa TaxID=2685164 RepID=UPI00343AF0E3